MRKWMVVGIPLFALLVSACGGADDSAAAVSSQSKAAPAGGIVMDGDRAFVKGVVSATVPTSNLTIGATTVNTTGAEFRDIAGNALTPAAFFGAVTVGVTEVKASWRPFVNASMPVQRVELEN